MPVATELHFGMQGPVGVVQCFAADRDQVGLLPLKDLFGLRAVQDQADRHGLNAGIVTDALRERHLKTRPAFDPGRSG